MHVRPWSGLMSGLALVACQVLVWLHIRNWSGSISGHGLIPCVVMQFVATLLVADCANWWLVLIELSGSFGSGRPFCTRAS